MDTMIRDLDKCAPKVSQLDIVGNAELLNSTIRVGIVGTRNATEQGLKRTRRLAHLLASNGATIVSGLGLGIDTQAHEGALLANGNTIAVLGTGTDIYYPQSNSELQKRIESRGCVISEYDRGTKPLAWHFPIRNRIISALSDLVIIPEGTYKGGVRITADLAHAMGKQIAVIPGDIDAPQSELPNWLIKNYNATPILNPVDALELIGINSEALSW